MNETLVAQANDYLNNTSWVALGLIQMLADNDLRIDEFMGKRPAKSPSELQH